MEQQDKANRHQLIQNWIYQAADHIRSSMQDPLQVSEKTSRKDLVTNMDKETESFLVEKIQQSFPNERILAEESSNQNTQDLNGVVWIIDPIDGTLNFVKQKHDFAIMIAVYEDGVGQMGYIYDVIKDEMYVGIKDQGVKCNQKQLSKVDDTSLAKGLVAISGLLLAEGNEAAKQVAKRSSGVRIVGSAGIETIYAVTGRIVAYVAASLAPWDIAAGKVIAEELGLMYTQQNGEPIQLLKKNPVLIATPSAHKEIFELLQGVSSK